MFFRKKKLTFDSLVGPD